MRHSIRVSKRIPFLVVAMGKAVKASDERDWLFGAEFQAWHLGFRVRGLDSMKVQGLGRVSQLEGGISNPQCDWGVAREGREGNHEGTRERSQEMRKV
eukprot:3940895-Rhodomonas_salina.9